MVGKYRRLYYFLNQFVICLVFLMLPLPVYMMSCWCCVDSLTTWGGEERNCKHEGRKARTHSSMLMIADCCRQYVKVFSISSEAGVVLSEVLLGGAVAADSEAVFFLFFSWSCCRALQFTLKCLSRDEANYKISEISSRLEIFLQLRFPYVDWFTPSGYTNVENKSNLKEDFFPFKIW